MKKKVFKARTRVDESTQSKLQELNTLIRNEVRDVGGYLTVRMDLEGDNDWGVPLVEIVGTQPLRSVAVLFSSSGGYAVDNNNNRYRLETKKLDIAVIYAVALAAKFS